MTSATNARCDCGIAALAMRIVLTTVITCTTGARTQMIGPALDNNGWQERIGGLESQVPPPGAQDPTTRALETDSQDPVASPHMQTAGGPLSTAEIMSLLNEQPELMVEMKAVAATRLSRDGTPLQDEDVTDERLYSEISTNTELRTAISNFLRARGYVGALTSTIGVPERSSTPTRPLRPSSDMYGAEERDAGYSAIPRLSNGAAAPSGSRRLTSVDGEPNPTAATEASTGEPKVLRRPAPYNLQAMRDLYTQIPESSRASRRFGSELFLHTRNSPLGAGVAAQAISPDVPLGPDYVLGSGDTLVLSLWGSTTQTFTRVVDGDGNLLLPEAGPLGVAGLTLGNAQALIESSMQRQYRSAHVSVTVARLRSVRVYVVGDVQRPGGYDVSPLATSLSVVYAAGGPTAAGSLRTLRHMRGNQLVATIDLYDLLVHGIRSGAAHFQSGDTLLVPPTGAQVAVSGGVLRPAIYELIGSEDSLASVIADAGGATAAAALDHITIERIDAHHGRETVTLHPHDAAYALEDFKVRDGDRVELSAILPYSQHAIYLEGHVVRPGRLAWVDGIRLCDVLRSYRDLLPEPDSHGEIVRLVPPDLHAETITFDLAEVLVGNDNLALQPFDTIRIRGRYDLDAPKVTISGQVLRPGVFPLSKDMTVAQLVRVAGGFKRDAFLDSADLTSYSVVDGRRVVSSLSAVRIGAAVDGSDASANIMLKPGDILNVHQVTGWNDIGEAVSINGQVGYPGSYGLREAERLSSVLRRAGGFRDGAYPEGAVLVREEVRELEEKSRQELIRQIETSSVAARLSPNLTGSDNGAALKLIDTQQQQILARLKSEPPSGRLVVHIDANIESWANTPADVELRRGDVITIPKRPGFVLITGQVYNPTALTFTPGKSAGWYLSRAGGANSTANRKEIFVIRSNGSVVGRHSSSIFAGDVLATRLNPGDVVVVPQKLVGASQLWRNLLTAAQLASSISITAAVAAL